MGKPIDIMSVTKTKVIYRVFEKEIGSSTPLIPLNRLPQTKANFKQMQYPLGLVENFFNESLYDSICDDINNTCPLPVSMQGLPQYTTLNALAYLQPGKELMNAIDVYESVKSLYPTFFAVIYNKKELHSTEDHKQLFRQPFWTYEDNWHESVVRQ